MSVFRDDFRELARIHLRGARTLLRSRQFTGSYYLAGLGVECGLKACIAKATRRYEFPDKNRTRHSYQHDLKKLVSAAGLQDSLDVETHNLAFAKNWSIVTDWHNESRYEVIGGHEAQAIYSAATARQQGVMRWIRQHW